MGRTEELVTRFLSSLKRYLGLQRDYILLEVTEKAARLLTVVLLGAVLLIVGTVAVVFMGLTLVEVLRELGGLSGWLSCLIVMLLCVAVAMLIYAMRKRWLLNPIVTVLSSFLLKGGGQESEQEKDEVNDDRGSSEPQA